MYVYIYIGIPKHIQQTGQTAINNAPKQSWKQVIPEICLYLVIKLCI